MSAADLVCVAILLVVLVLGTTLKVYTRKKLQELDGVNAVLIIEPKNRSTIEKRNSK